MITAENLCKCFDGRPVLQNVSFSVSGPAVLSGPSGCGKTTLLRILMGLEAADSGSFAPQGLRIAAVFQENRLCPQLTAADNICLVSPALPKPQAEKELRALGFTDADLAVPAARLSGGQKRRAALLRALLQPDAQLLLLDEPFTGMDPALIADAMQAIRCLCGGRDLLLVSHEAGFDAGWPVVSLPLLK